MSKLKDYFKGDELAANVWKSKYAADGEETPDDMHKRLSKEFARIELSYMIKETSQNKNKLSSYGQNRKPLTNDAIYNLFKDFKYVIPQGSIMSQLGVESYGSLSNCFVIGQPEDSYGGIFEKDQQLAQLMKRRGGVGIDISTLRPADTAVSNAARSSTGAVSFMHRFSNTTREVAQNGRRGALMISIDVNHPDVVEFARIKRDLSQVTGANISIKLNNEFMEAVESDKEYILRYPTEMHQRSSELATFEDSDDIKYNELYNIDGSYFKRVKAKEVWDEIIKSAHNVAEPGLMFWDNMVEYSPDGAYDEFRQVTTNPCSEIGMQPYDACRLIAVNLFSFVVNPFLEDAYFDYDKFYEVNYEAMRLSDDLIDLELEHIDRIMEKILSDPESVRTKKAEHDLWMNVKKTAEASRRTGLGFTALGDTLAALNIPYDSQKALSEIEYIMKMKMTSELDCTTDLSIQRGSFKGWERSIEYSGTDIIADGKNSFYDALFNEFPSEVQRMMKYGRRNVSWSTVAPTGTVSLMTQTTSGIEPLFQPFYMRRKKINPNDENSRVDFTDQNGDTWQEFPILHPKFKEWLEIYGDAPSSDCYSKEELERFFSFSPWKKSTANDIDWLLRVEIQGVIQRYITHSISSTINLPEDVSEEEVSNIYLESWKKGLKGITVYRDGSRSGVLVTNTEKHKEEFSQHDAPKRPKHLPCDIYTVNSKGKQWNVVIGLLDSKPYEVFAFPQEISDSYKKGALYKKKSGFYSLISNEKEIITNISDLMNFEEVFATRLISTSLRHGANIKYVVEQLNKSHGDITSFSKSIARVLKKYIPNGEKSTATCRDCNSKNVVFEEGCEKCLECGSSKCG